MLKKIMSGGQTGVDRAALDVGIELANQLRIIVGGLSKTLVFGSPGILVVSSYKYFENQLFTGLDT